MSRSAGPSVMLSSSVSPGSFVAPSSAVSPGQSASLSSSVPPHAEDLKVLLLAMMHEMVMSDGGGLEMMKVTAKRRSHEGAHDGVVPARSRPQYRLNASSAPAPPPWVNVMMMMMRPQEMMHEWVVQVVVAGIMEGMAMMRVMITMIV